MMPAATQAQATTMRAFAQSLRDNDFGVGIIQFVFIFPFLFLIIIGIMDLARFLAVMAILNKGADNALNLAVKIPDLDIDIRGLNPTDPDYLIFREARRRVINEAVRLPLRTLITDFDVPSSAHLLPITITDSALALGAGETAPTTTRGAVVLRPGERAELDRNGTKSWVEHKTLPPNPDGSPPAQPPEMLLKGHPLEIELRADVDMFLPMLGNLVARGSAMGFRGEIPRGPLPPDPDDPGGGSSTSTTTTVSTTVVTTSKATTTLSCVLDWPNAFFYSNRFFYPFSPSDDTDPSNPNCDTSIVTLMSGQ